MKLKNISVYLLLIICLFITGCGEEKTNIATKFNLPTKKPNMTTDILRKIVEIEQKQKGTWAK